MTSYLNTINSEGVVLHLNNTAGQGVVVGNSLTSILGTRTFGDSTIGAITGTSSASFSTTLSVTGLTILLGGLISTSGTTTLGTSTIGAITGTSATFSSTLGVTGITTLGETTIGDITGTSASFSSNTSSSSKTTGAVTVVGGISTEENINIGGYIGLFGSISGVVSIKTQPESGTFNFNLPTSSGTSGQVLTSGGGLSSPMTWTTPTIGTVTSVSLSVPPFLSISGSPVTTSGILEIGFSGTALSVQNGGTGVTTFASNSLLIGNGIDPIETSIGASYSTNTLTLPKITSNDTTPTTSSTTGSILVSGGIAIQNTTDATSITNGGTITTAGGVSIAKKLFVGGMSSLNGLNLNNTKITNLSTPTQDTDGATKGYVDLAIQGLDAKDSVVVATTISGVMATSFQNGQVVDGETLVTGDRILIKNQGDVNNGIYIVNVSGTPTRALDFDTGASVAGSFIFIEKGATNSDSGWVCSSDTGSDVVGTNTLTFVQFSGAGSIIAGTGLIKNGNELSVGSIQTQITQLGTITTGTWNASVIGVQYGGTGSTSFATNNLLIGNGTNPIEVSTGASYSLNTLTLPKITSNDITPSISNTTGSILVSGGIGIENTTDATSVTNGGTITTAGGVAIAKKLFVGGESTFNGVIKANGIFPQNPTGDGVFIGMDNVNNTSIQLNGPISYIDFSTSGVDFRGRIIYESNSDRLEIYTNTVEQMRILSNGDIGVGTTNPLAKLDVNGEIKGNLMRIINTTPSTSSISGSFLIAGGIGIQNTTDAISVTNGGTITTAGGASIGKKLFVGDSITSTGFTSSTGFLARGSTSGIISILPQPNSGTFNFNLPITPGVTGQILASAGGGNAPMSWITPALASAPQTYNASGLQSQVSPVDVGGLFYTTGFFDITMTVDIVSSTSLKQLFKITGLLSPTSGWSINVISITGDDSLVNFSITAGGQVQYTSGTYTGFVSLTFYWTEFSTTQGVGYLALSGANSGIVTISPQPDAGTYNYNLPTTAGTIGQVLTSGGGGSSPMSWANFSVGDITISGAVNQTISGTTGVSSLVSLIPDLADDSANALVFGRNTLTNESAVIRFGKRETTNYLGLGFWANDDIFNVSANGNVGVGTTSPQFKLDVNGDSRISNGVLYLESGTISEDPNVELNNKTNTYIRFGTAGSNDDWAYLRQIGGANEMNIALDMHDDSVDGGFMIRSIGSSENAINPIITTRFKVSRVTGNVGIGTPSPGSILDVVSSSPIITIRNNTSSEGKIYFGNNSHGVGRNPMLGTLSEENDVGLWTGGTGSLGFVTDGVIERMRILPNGNVGIGTVNPSSKLDVNGTITINSSDVGQLKFINASVPKAIELSGPGGLAMIALAANISDFILESFPNDMIFRSQAKIHLLGTNIVTNSNVGIGTTTPNCQLQLANSLVNRKLVLFEDANNDHQYYGFGMNNDTLRYQVADTSHRHSFFASVNGSSSNELMRIQGDGNVGIGTINPVSSLSVKKDQNDFTSIQIRNNNQTNTTSGTQILFGGFRDVTQDSHSLASIRCLVTDADIPNVKAGHLTFLTGENDSPIPYGELQEHMRITRTGNIGIGTTTPEFKLDVSGTLNVSGFGYFRGGIQTGDPAAGSGFDLGSISNKSLNIRNSDGLWTHFNTEGTSTNDIRGITRFSNTVVLNDNRLLLRQENDNAHGLQWNSGPDGPILWGSLGGRLSTGSNGSSTALSWSSSGISVTGTVAPTSYSGITTNFSSVSQYDIPIDLTNYQHIDIIIRQNYTSVGDTTLTFNGGTNLSEYTAIFVPFVNPLSPMVNQTNVLFTSHETGTNDSYVKITVTRASTPGGRYTVNFRGSYCISNVGQSRVDGVSQSQTVITSLRISVTLGTTSGSYTIFNKV